MSMGISAVDYGKDRVFGGMLPQCCFVHLIGKKEAVAALGGTAELLGAYHFAFC